MNQPGILELISFGPDGWGKALMAGAWMTILVALSGYAIGSVIGTFGAWAKISGGRGLKIAADTYTTVLRGIPDLLVIYLFYFGGSAAVTALGRLFGAEGFLGFPGFLAGSLAVGVTSGAQFTEVFRGAFKAVHRGEIEAAIACGMGRALRFRRIVAPLTLRHALPGLTADATSRAAGPRQCLAGRSEGIRTRLHYRRRRTPSPDASGGRIDWSSLRFLYRCRCDLSHHFNWFRPFLETG